LEPLQSLTLKAEPMAMNNWGGIKEHMTKTPRKAFGSRKETRTFSRSTPRLSKAAEHLAIRKKRERTIRDLVLFGLVLVASVYAIWEWWFG